MLSAKFRQAIAIATIGLALLALPAGAAETRSRAEYTVTMGGTHVANVTLILTDNGGQYALALDAKIAGLAQLVASGSARATSIGTSGANGLRFASTIRGARRSGVSPTSGRSWSGARRSANRCCRGCASACAGAPANAR